MNLKMFVATHKKYWMPDDSVYVPLHVGREGKEDIGYLADNTEDNISLKNNYYCELTGLYWIWKNVSSDYVGLCHYRRYFARNGDYRLLKSKKLVILTEREIIHYLENYDIIMPRKIIFQDDTVRRQYEKCHNAKDLIEIQKIIYEMYPEYNDDFEAVMMQHDLYAYNMFVTNKKLLCEYCSWLFDILFELEKRIDIRGYDQYQARVYGFLSERLFNVWLYHRKLKIKECDIVFLDDEKPRKLHILTMFINDLFLKLMDGLRASYR